MIIKRQLTITTTIIIVLVIAVSAGVIIPKIDTILQVNNQIQHTQKELETFHDRSVQLKKTIRELHSAEAFAKEISQSVISSQSQIGLITDLERIAEKNNLNQTFNVELRDITKDTLENHTAYTKVGITSFYALSFLNKGTLEQHLQYLDDLEKTLPYYIQLHTLTFSKPQSPEEQSQNSLLLKLEGRVFIANTSDM